MSILVTRLRVRRQGAFVLAVGFMLLASIGCRSGADEEPDRPQGWSEASHANGVEPDYELLFSTNRVERLSIRLEEDTTKLMADDLRTALAGDIDPSWFSATVTHDSRVWEHVGIRYRGNGTISDIQEAGSAKYPFRLTFDKFEGEFPETKNQRFYGFKKLNFSTSARDDSLIREVLASETLVEAGVPTARASFVRIYLDEGEGEQYLGLYSLVEDLDDVPMQEEQLGGEDGNLYKPLGESADLTKFVEADFEKKNNRISSDFTDVESLISSLNASVEDPSAWRESLERTFDVDGFLRFLAANATLGNHEGYGCEAQNYFLYGVPEQQGQLMFVPWDLDRAFSPEQERCGKRSLGEEDFLFRETYADWPLIGRILSESTYRATYESYLDEMVKGAFESGALTARAEELHSLIRPYVHGDDGEREGFRNYGESSVFLEALTVEGGLNDAISERASRVTAALGAASEE